ncbi:O-acetylhomoserine aminocarboxypropyltransferase/cysteine synthase family protein [Arenibaculum sp.]|jgi:O-acetylhomoserine (thiol)-lyase|uniref:O-acetylhomoserine aminocarboxypropyltransferase/cysteine synthase family protein n=1 Tax=Arenibaculum sp. TaxID=2865862 RepID=UPI002E0EE376|nr:O-acetylhomoserine aminocarboxypropyltransferase/cysteine synthase family protein [Arenibaculum sp.]
MNEMPARIDPAAASPGEGLHPETVVLHTGFRYDPTTYVTTVPIYQSNAYFFPSIDYASDVFDLRTSGRTYSRLMNPTCDVFEERIAAFEGGAGALLTSSGQAAITLAILNLAKSGDNIISSSQLYGGTWNLLARTFARLGVETRFVDPTDPEAFRAATDERTRCYFGEALPNPMLVPFPIREVGAIAREIGVPLVIDNTMTPYISRPFDLGADIIVHSVTKYICGHGTAVGGVVIDKGTFDWHRHAERFPLMTQPDEAHGNILWLEAVKGLDGAYGRSPYLLKMRNTLQRDFGACASAFSAFLFLQGLETLPLRMPRHCENARQVAEMLSGHAKVLDVTYPTMGDARMTALARENMGGYGGPMVQFEIAGGIEAGKRFIQSLQLIYHVSNIGDARTLATHPASTTHASVPREARLAAGVKDGTIRLSVGLEHIGDILGDLERALGAA